MPEPNRDVIIIEHVRQFHLTTPSVLHRLFFADSNPNAVTKVTTRLVREGKLRRCPLFERRCYFVLTPKAAAKLGEDRSIGEPFQHQGLVNALGVLYFCVENGFAPFSRRTFEVAYPSLIVRGVRAGNYYTDIEQLDVEEADDGEVKRLGFVVVDYGSSVQTVLGKIHKVISRPFGRDSAAGESDAFRKLLRGGQFVIAVVTPTEEKADAIRAAIENGEPTNVIFRVEAVPELAEFLLATQGRNESAVLQPDTDLSAGGA